MFHLSHVQQMYSLPTHLTHESKLCIQITRGRDDFNGDASVKSLHIFLLSLLSSAKLCPSSVNVLVHSISCNSWHKILSPVENQAWRVRRHRRSHRRRKVFALLGHHGRGESRFLPWQPISVLIKFKLGLSRPLFGFAILFAAQCYVAIDMQTMWKHDGNRDMRSSITCSMR